MRLLTQSIQCTPQSLLSVRYVYVEAKVMVNGGGSMGAILANASAAAAIMEVIVSPNMGWGLVEASLEVETDANEA